MPLSFSRNTSAPRSFVIDRSHRHHESGATPCPPRANTGCVELAIGLDSGRGSASNRPMSTWVDPTFGEAIASAGLIALGRVVDSDPRGAHIAIVRTFAGGSAAGEVVHVRRSTVVGRGHEGMALPRGETFAFVVRAGEGSYDAFTDSYWAFSISDGAYVHVPVRDPFTRAYILFDVFAELVRLMRDRNQSPATYLAWQCTRLGQTPVAANQPVEVNDQIVALESLAHLGSAVHSHLASSFLGSPHFQVRWSAVRALAKCGGPSSARPLLDLLSREDVPPVQAALAEALSSLADATMRGEIEAALPRMYASTMAYSRNVMSPIMNLMPCPRDVLAAAVAKLGAPPAAEPPDQVTTPTAAHLRATASKKNLLALCASTPQGAVPLVEDGELFVLTARENIGALEDACRGRFGAHKLTLQPIEDGVGIFASFPPTVKSIRLDPGAPGDETFSGSRLTELRDMARSIAVSRVAESPGTHDAATFGRVMRDHRRFVVPLQPMTLPASSSAVTSLSTEIIDGRVVPYEVLRHQRPDGTHYAVAFTWEDCASAFFAALGSRTRTVVVDGETLFRELRRSEEAYGATSLVLDMEGPAKQTWLKISAWRLVLT